MFTSGNIASALQLEGFLITLEIEYPVILGPFPKLNKRPRNVGSEERLKPLNTEKIYDSKAAVLDSDRQLGDRLSSTFKITHRSRKRKVGESMKSRLEKLLIETAPDIKLKPTSKPEFPTPAGPPEAAGNDWVEIRTASIAVIFRAVGGRIPVVDIITRRGEAGRILWCLLTRLAGCMAMGLDNRVELLAGFGQFSYPQHYPISKGGRAWAIDMKLPRLLTTDNEAIVAGWAGKRVSSGRLLCTQADCEKMRSLIAEKKTSLWSHGKFIRLVQKGDSEMANQQLVVWRGYSLDVGDKMTLSLVAAREILERLHRKKMGNG